MWVRSQDKKVLIEVESFYLSHLQNGQWAILGVGWQLGIYETKDRAIEVLSMIERYIEELEEKCVYQMPKE